MADKEPSSLHADRDGHDSPATESRVGGAGVLVVFCTVGDDASAGTLARVLVEERLAACVSRAAVQSTYRWEGQVRSEGEVLLVIKTQVSLWSSLRRRIRELHSYECPEVVAVDAAAVDAKYLEWLLASCGAAD